jgi:hypothetical protein
MQKVVGSSPIIRFAKAPQKRGFSLGVDRPHAALQAVLQAAATTQILSGPTVSEIGTAGFGRPDD